MILETKLQRGRWTILKHPEHSGHWLSHQCKPIGPDGKGQILAEVQFTRYKYGIWQGPYRFRTAKWRCTCCWKTAPDTIIGAFTLLEMDKVADRIQEVMGGDY
jgi:hypothetical protein